MKASTFRPAFFESADDPRYPALFAHRNDCAAAVIHPRSFRVYMLSWGGVLTLARLGFSTEFVLSWLKARGFTVWRWDAGVWEAL